MGVRVMAAGVSHFIGRMNKDYKPNDEVYTPPYIFEALGLEFDLDVCGPVGGLDWIPARKTFSVEDDGLAQTWYGRVWMNPPFSAPNDWVVKWLENANGVMVCTLSKSKWFQMLWNSPAAICYLPASHKYIKPDGSKYSIAFPTAMWAIGETNITALKASGLGKLR
jgi:hypothetical protein